MSIVHFRWAWRRNRTYKEKKWAWEKQTVREISVNMRIAWLTKWINVNWREKRTNNHAKSMVQSLEQRKNPNWISHSLVTHFMLFHRIYSIGYYAHTHTFAIHNCLVFGISESRSDYADNFFCASVWVEQWLDWVFVSALYMPMQP